MRDVYKSIEFLGITFTHGFVRRPAGSGGKTSGRHPSLARSLRIAPARRALAVLVSVIIHDRLEESGTTAGMGW